MPGVVIQSQLEEGFPHLAAGIRPIMATLVRHGMAEDALAHDQNNAAWRITPFGRHCLTYLQDKVPEAG